MTEIERIIRDIEPRHEWHRPDEQPIPVQVPGFRNPDDSRIPAALRQAAIVQAHQQQERKRRRRAR